MEGFEELLTTFRDSKHNIHISESKFGSEIDCFQGLGLKCLHIQVNYDQEQWGSIAAAPPWGPNALNHSPRGGRRRIPVECTS